MANTALQSLQLVFDELTVTLNDTRVALEQYAEGEAGNQPLERCAGLLHTVRGVLQLTETWGASLLAEEMEQTCRHLLKSRRESHPDDAVEALMRAAVQLPAYVERIRNGGRDVPLILLPLLNDLRAARGRPLLSESTLLLLNVAPAPVGRAVAPARQPSGEDVVALCRQLRPRFQLGLLAWIRGERATEAMAQLRSIAGRLEAAATDPVVHQLWWVVAGVLEALADGGIEPSVAIKRLIGQADREMKRLQTLGERRFANQPPVELVNNLLYYVARARSSGPRVAGIRESFNLSGLIPGDEQVEAARQGLAAPSVKLMQTVAGAIREDLARVKDVLDIYVRTGMERVEELAPQVELLKKIGDTLGVLGLGELRASVQTRRAELEELVAGIRKVDEAALVSMAAALLDVEDSLERQLIGLVSPADEPATGAESGDGLGAAQDGIQQVVMRECLANLTRVKDAISLVTERQGEASALDAVPGLLRGITAALLLLERERAAAISEGIAHAVRAVVAAGYPEQPRAALERLADAIVSLEYYMETIQAGRRDPDWMLDNAARCLEALAEERPAAVAAALAPAAVEPEPEATQVLVRAVRSGPSAERPVVRAGGEGIDPEILELFIEEAREAIETINTRFPSWELDEGDQDALLTVRRAYHTLKGSGRMVGAELIGEFCWSIEHLLNRIIEGTVTRSPVVLQLLRRANGAIGELLEQLEVGSAPVADIAGLMAEAERCGRPPAAAPVDLSAGVVEATELLPVLSADEALVEPAESAVAPSATSEPAAPAGVPAQTVPPAMDPVLLDILSREVSTHLGVLRDWAGRAGESLPQPLPEAVFRACHTLHGSLTMAGVGPGVALAGPLNELMGVLFQAHLPVEAAVVAACRDTAAALAAVVDRLREPLGPLPEFAPLTGRLEQLLAEASAAASAPAEEGTLAGDLPVLREQPEPTDEPVAPAPGGPAPVTETPPEEPAAPTLLPDPELAEIFAEEAAELLETCERALAILVGGPDDGSAMAELQRGLHTLKGGARMAGLPGMGDLSHELETLLLRGSEGIATLGGDTWNLVQAVLDELHRLRDQIPQGRAGSPAPALLARLAAALRVGPGAVAAPTPAEAAPSAVPTAGATAGPEPLPAAGEPAVLPAVTPTDASPTADWVLPEPTGLEPALPPVTPPEPALLDAEDLEPTPPEPWLDEAATLDGGIPAGELPVEVAPGLPAGTSPPRPPALERLGELARELEAPPVASQPPAPPAAPLPGREARPAETREFARVESGLLEQLLNGAGEISVANSRLSQQLSSIQFNLAELSQTVVRLRDQLRKLEIETEAQILYRHQGDGARDADFDPLELDRYSSIQQLSRALAETASDVSSLKDLLQNLSADTEGLLLQQARTTTELQDGLMRTRMVPFDQHGSRLARLVRQTAKETGRQAELVIEGSGELDRQVLEKMLPPFEHMLRNAVIHGLETPAEREALGKPVSGMIRISIRREGAEVVIDITDDGRGLDVAAIRRKAVELGLVGRNDVLTDEQAMQLILRPGFSTADCLTQAAGRGIGMDVVASQVAKLGGTLTMSSRRGLGTTFCLRLPFTLAVTQALIVRAGSELYALPLPTVEGIIRISRREFDERMARPEPAIEYGGQKYLFRHLGEFLGLGPSRLPEEQERISIILVRAGENSTALVADEMLDSREIVVKPVGAQLATIRGISGATILGDGRIVVILDAGALVRLARPVTVAPPPVPEPEAGQPLALVVDDSITMRRVTQRLLERNGFRVITAKDGVEAISMLQDHRPQIILLDVEMPRMDGYEFARHVRNNPATADLPIIMVTSRVSEKHRARAIEIGVNDYLGKPYQEQELLEAVHHLLAPA